MKWTSPSSEDGNYVTYYNISYSPPCPEFLSVSVTLVSVTTIPTGSPKAVTASSKFNVKQYHMGRDYFVTYIMVESLSMLYVVFVVTDCFNKDHTTLFTFLLDTYI